MPNIKNWERDKRHPTNSFGWTNTKTKSRVIVGGFNPTLFSIKKGGYSIEYIPRGEIYNSYGLFQTKTKKQAKKLAVKWMRRHPRGD